MADALNPTPASRIAGWVRPDWTRTVLARRVAAGGLVALAAIAALRSDPHGEHTEVVVAAHDLRPGTTLTADDVRLENRLTATIPDGAQTDVAVVADMTLAGPTRRGEVLTDVRVLGARLAESAAGPQARIVGVHPADSGLIGLLRPGDVVDILVGADSDSTSAPRLVATHAVVVLVSERQDSPNDRVALVALPAAAATAVAAAALAQVVTLILH